MASFFKKKNIDFDEIEVKEIEIEDNEYDGSQVGYEKEDEVGEKVEDSEIEEDDESGDRDEDEFVDEKKKKIVKTIGISIVIASIIAGGYFVGPKILKEFGLSDFSINGEKTATDIKHFNHNGNNHKNTHHIKRTHKPKGELERKEKITTKKKVDEKTEQIAPKIKNHNMPIEIKKVKNNDEIIEKLVKTNAALLEKINELQKKQNELVETFLNYTLENKKSTNKIIGKIHINKMLLTSMEDEILELNERIQKKSQKVEKAKKKISEEGGRFLKAFTLSGTMVLPNKERVAFIYKSSPEKIKMLRMGQYLFGKWYVVKINEKSVLFKHVQTGEEIEKVISKKKK